MTSSASHVFSKLALATFLALLSGCGTTGSYLKQAISSSTKVQNFEIDSGDYRLISFSTGRPSDESSMKTIFYVGGSGCISLRTYLAVYFRSLPEGFNVVALEKVGVRQTAIPTSCTELFWDNYTYDRLLARNKTALLHLQNATKDRVHAIVGTSEGGPIALELAAQSPNIPKVVVIGAGGMLQREELEALAKRNGDLDKLRTLLAKVDADPSNRNAWALGYPHPYWSSVLDRDPQDYLPAVHQPVFLLIGANDNNVPVASARRAHTLLSNSQLVEWPNANHVFATQDGNQRDAVIGKVGEFLLSQ